METARLIGAAIGREPVVDRRIAELNYGVWEGRTFEEIERVVTLAAGLGIDKVRLTGGEPLLRRQIEKLVERIARIPGIRDLAMTSNGFYFPRQAAALRDAGLRRVSFSLDSLDAANFKKITGREGLASVLESITSLRVKPGMNSFINPPPAPARSKRPARTSSGSARP